MQPRQIEESMMFACKPLFPRRLAEVTRLELQWDPRQYIADQFLAKADVIRAMHERVRLCQDPQTEFAPLRESHGVLRINHILRCARSHNSSMERDKPPKSSMKFEQRSLERLFPGFTRGAVIFFGTNQAQCRPVVYWVQESAGRCRHRTRWSTLSSQTTNSGHGSRRSHRLTSPETTFCGAPWTPSLKQPPPSSLRRSMARRNPQQSCTCKRQPRQRTSPGSKLLKGTMVPPS